MRSRPLSRSRTAPQGSHLRLLPPLPPEPPEPIRPQWVEVSVLWGDNPLGVVHVRPGERFFVGEKVPEGQRGWATPLESIAWDAFASVSETAAKTTGETAGGYTLVAPHVGSGTSSLERAGMGFDVRIPSQAQHVTTSRQKGGYRVDPEVGLARIDKNHRVFSLRSDASCAFTLGELTFQFQLVPAATWVNPPHPNRRFHLVVFGVSFALHALFLVLLLTSPFVLFR